MRHLEKGMEAGQDSPPGGMSYAARRKGDRLRARERELRGNFFLGRISQVDEGLERNEFGGMVTGVYTWVWWSMVMSNMKDGYEKGVKDGMHP